MENKRLGEGIIYFSGVFVPCMSFIAAAVLFLMAISRTCWIVADGTNGGLAEIRSDNPYYNIIFIVILGCVLYLFDKGHSYIRKLPFLAAGIALSALLGFAFVYSASRIPAGDAEIIANAAFQMSRGDYSGMEEYFTAFPFSLGLAFFEESFFMILKLLFPSISKGYSFMALQMANVIMLAVAMLAVIKISGLIFKSERTERICALMLFTAFPIMLSATSLSGRTPALMFALLSMWMLLAYFREDKLTYAVISAVFIAFAVSIKLDYAVFLIAELVVIFLESMQKGRPRMMFLLPVFLAFSIACPAVSMVIYAEKSGAELLDGEHNVYAAMGLADEEDRYLSYRGIYNAMNYAMEGTKGSRAELGKTTWKSVQEQWNEPNFRTLQNNRDSIHYRKTGFVYKKICYDNEKNIVNFSNMWQMLLLIGFMLGLACQLKRGSIAALLPVLCVLGGFLMHVIYSAQSQHAMKYYIMMIPIAANGFEKAFDYHSSKGDKT